MEQLEPIEKKICRACNIAKKLKSFQTLKSGNKAGVCNLCKSQGKKIPKEHKSKPVIKNIALQLGFIRKEDYVEMYKAMEKMGYNLSKDLHEQFCKKYGLTPNKPKQKFNNYYTQKDCGLI
jgi:methylphosphotriester-DNA--protein-cysteine methyltransferase